MNFHRKGAKVWEDVEKWFVTPAKAGVQDIRINEVIKKLDSGLRRNDGFACFDEFFNDLLVQNCFSLRTSRLCGNKFL